MSTENIFYQSSTIPYRIIEGSLEILLITSIRKGRWIVPKGYVDYNLTGFESAKKEAYEEAGVLGSNETVELGSYKFEKESSTFVVKVYSMEVVEELEKFPEVNLRKRKWFPFEEAIEKIEVLQMKEFFNKLKKIAI